MSLKWKAFVFGCCCCLLAAKSGAQTPKAASFTRADTLRGSITKERAWWDVLRYDLTIKPDYPTQTTTGSNSITYKVVSNAGEAMQIDLKEPLQIDSVLLGETKLAFQKEGAVWHVQMPAQKKEEVHSVVLYFSGKPVAAKRPPWNGGWTFATDSLGRPWMTVTCQGTGASLWYPCKDHQSDEPDKGASLTMIVPDSLVAVSNGRLASKKNVGKGLVAYKWTVVNPINNYNLIPYIGKYVNFSEVFKGEKGKLAIAYWVLDYDLAKAKMHLPADVHNMLRAFEYWFGPYPFYEDGYKLVEAPHLGMEHQSAVAYGNQFLKGYLGKDWSNTGWGLKWDFIIVHESGHEWFGNNITAKDIADMWVHEGFTNYSETLFVDYLYGKTAGDAYNKGIRSSIQNDRPVIGNYGVNDEGSGDMYFKGGNLLHTLRHSMHNDGLFRAILRGLNKTFYHQTVTTSQVENYISQKAGFDYSHVFDQYLRTTQIPKLEYYFQNGNTVFFRWTNCVSGFDLPLVLKKEKTTMRVVPKEGWQSKALNADEVKLWNKEAIENQYYISAEQVKH